MVEARPRGAVARRAARHTGGDSRVVEGQSAAGLEARIDDPMRRWKLSETDLYSRTKWVEYSRAKDEMMLHTHTPDAPWYTVEADDKKTARLTCISHLLDSIEYKDVLPGAIELPKRPPIKDDYVRPPRDENTVLLTLDR